MSTLAKFMIVVGADNHPPMLDKPMYESWKSRMELYIQRKDHGRIILNSVEKGPLIWPTVEQEDGTVRLKTYEELSNKEKLQADCDLKATNIGFMKKSISANEREVTTGDSAGNALGANPRKVVRVFINPNVATGKHSDTLKFVGVGLPVSATGLGLSPIVSNSSPLVSHTAPINMPRGLYNVDLSATFGVPLENVGDLHMLIKDLEDGKHDELLSGITNDDCMAIIDTLDDSRILNVDESTMQGIDQPKGSDPILQSVDINTNSYAGVASASAKEQPKVSSNFRPLVADPVFDGVNISIPRKVVEKGGPWLIRKSSIILKKWSMDTRLLKEELTHIPIWVKLHDVPIQVFEEDGISLIAMFIGKHIMLDSYTSSMCNESWGRSSFARCLIEVNSESDLVDVVTIGIPSLTGDDFTKETIYVEYEWRPPRCDTCKIFGHVHDSYPKKVVTPPIVVTSNVVTPTIEKTNDGFQMVGKKKKNKDGIRAEVIEN
ncbi:zinc knuckle CX2CX4HX4C containing protein [Tanacetum coccineum]